jgi:hypothetical protein
MGALSEIVLNTASDPGRAQAWVTGALGPDGAEVRVEPAGDGVRIEWGPADDPHGSGSLTVSTDGAGASTAELRLRCAPTEPDPAERMLAALAEEVEQNFTAG